MRARILGIIAAMSAGMLISACETAVTPSPEPTPTPTDTAVTLLAIPGVTAPATGATPVTSVDSSQYAGTVSWSPAVGGTFAAVTSYTATIQLSPKAGYTLSGVAADGFTVAGASSAVNAADSGVVTASFPRTLLGLALIDVPAGRFQRNATAGNDMIITQAYRMSRCEISREQFLAIMGSDPSDASLSTGDRDPVQQANWYHAIAFCNKLSLAEGLPPVYSVSGVSDWENLAYASIPTSLDAAWDAAAADWNANGYRLPTEMEWMWAAMGAPSDGQGGGTNTTGYLKAFSGSSGSNAIDDYAWHKGNSDTKTHPVGVKSANELGLCDMSGNVWELCWDWWGAYPGGAQTDYRGAASGEFRSNRGGSRGDMASSCTVACRGGSYPGDQEKLIGFRVVRR